MEPKNRMQTDLDLQKIKRIARDPVWCKKLRFFKEKVRKKFLENIISETLAKTPGAGCSIKIYLDPKEYTNHLNHLEQEREEITKHTMPLLANFLSENFPIEQLLLYTNINQIGVDDYNKVCAELEVLGAQHKRIYPIN